MIGVIFYMIISLQIYHFFSHNYWYKDTLSCEVQNMGNFCAK